MPLKAVQQFQIRSEIGTERKARATLQAMKASGYEGIELCGFMIRKTPIAVRAITRLAGMPIGRSGKLEWKRLLRASDLAVVAIHQDLGSILKRPREIASEAAEYGTKNIVVTGMYRFDYSDEHEVLRLAGELNEAGKTLAAEGIHFLYHNHNCEFRRVESGKTAYQLLVEETDERYVNFEFDSYWPTEAGCDAAQLMRALGNRMKLYHINDRGIRKKGPAGSILKSDSMELGYGNMDIAHLIKIATENDVEAVILESHRNWVENSAVRSFQLSAEFLDANL
jgi:Sugar phosphate isomerases/epimerases